MNVTRIHAKFGIVLSMTVLLLLSACASSSTTTGSGASASASGSPPPAGYSKYLVYIANGSYNPKDPTEEPPNGDYFFHQIMGWNNAQIAEQKAQAIAFFKTRFGLDFSKSEQVGNLMLFSFWGGHAINYRVYTISGMQVPRTGWWVEDGGWMAMVGKGGTTLYGTYAGATGMDVPADTSLVFGYYHIQPEATPGQPTPAPITIYYQSHGLMLPDPSGDMAFVCDLSSPELGRGIAYGVESVQPLANGRMKVDVRNVLTFFAHS
jgi:hypothetical protein